MGKVGINIMCRVISVSNQKGGVLKSSTCVNLGIGLAKEGYKVLLIDADPQGSMSISLGYQEPDKIDLRSLWFGLRADIRSLFLTKR